MKAFNTFQKRLLFNYIWGSLLAVFGVGSVFIFRTLHLSASEVLYLLCVMLVSVAIMLTCEMLVYRMQIKPVKRVFKNDIVSKEDMRAAHLMLHHFPIMTVKRILGPHLFGLSIPATLFAWLGITEGWLHLPYPYIGFAWIGAVLVGIMHALIEFFLTYRAVQLLLPDFHAKSKRELGVGVVGEDEYYLSIKKKLLVSSIFTAVFPVALLLLASQIRLSEGRGVGLEGYWSWASAVALVILVMALVASLLLYKSIETPMEHLRDRFDDVRNGELTPMNNVYADEFSNLVTGFNHMVKSIKDRDAENERLIESFFTVFAATLDARDPYTAGHSERVAEYSVMIAKRAGFDDEQLDLLKKSALLHDIGKIGVRDDVLLKEGHLTEEEFNQIKKHPVIGADILTQVQLPDALLPLLSGVRHHHERYDGKGYPDGMGGERIPLFGRLMAVADAFDAMTSDRPYRKGMPLEKALSIIEDGKGTQWDPYFASLFLEEMAEGQLEQKAGC